MTDPTRPVLDHAPRCDRRGAPLLRLAWRDAPVAICPSCGATAPAPDTRHANTEGNQPGRRDPRGRGDRADNALRAEMEPPGRGTDPTPRRHRR